jgi:hypothetical protein
MKRNEFVVVRLKTLKNGTKVETDEIVIDGRGKPFVKDENDVLYTYKDEIEKKVGGEGIKDAREHIRVIIHPFA